MSKTSICVATLRDVDRACDVFSRFAANAQSLLPVKFESLEELRPEFLEVLTKLIESDSAIVLIAEAEGNAVGLLAGVVAPTWFQKTKYVAQELAWWVDEEFRSSLVGVRLFMAFEEWAKLTGAESIIMSSIETGSDNTGRFLERTGYKKSDTNYIKRIS